MQDFAAVCRARFPGSISDERFVRASTAAAAKLGFEPAATIACVGLCRDELTRDLRDRIQRTWGEAFDFSGLAGMLFLGRTGFMAAHAHAPVVGGRERYAYFALPHIAIDADGIIGRCTRTGRPGPSTACGALAAFLVELSGNRLRLTTDPLDLEQTRLQQRLAEVLSHGQTPTLAEATECAERLIRDDLQRMIELTLDPGVADCVAFTGIQIHGPDGGYVRPGACWAVIEGETRPFDLADWVGPSALA